MQAHSLDLQLITLISREYLVSSFLEEEEEEVEKINWMNLRLQTIITMSVSNKTKINKINRIGVREEIDKNKEMLDGERLLRRLLMISLI